MLKKMKTPRSIIKQIAAILLIVFVVFNIINYINKPPISEANPSIEAKLLDGTAVTLQQYQGKPLIIYFWATWCPTCKFESPVMEKLSQDYQVLSICVYSGTYKQVAEFMDRNGYSFPVINDYDNEIRRIFNVKAVPTIFVLDSQGKIIFSEVGMTSEIGLKIRMMLAE